MIEAYEIGIKLALQDGVSEGIAAIRRDLGSLDLAIAQTTLRLNQLQRVGAQALTASQEQPERPAAGVPARRPAAVVTPPPAEAVSVASPIEAQAVVSASIPRPGSVASPAAVLAVPRVAGAEPGPVSPATVARPEITAPEAAPRLPAIVVEAVRTPGSSRPPEQPTAVRPVGAVLPPTSTVSVPAVARLVVPTLQAGEPQRQGDVRRRENVLPRPEKGVSVTPASATAAPPQAAVESERRERARLPVHRHEEVRERHLGQVAAASSSLSTRMAPAPTGPAAVFSSTAPATSSVSPSYAPPAASPRSSETGVRGDVFLDGTKVGRWMSEQMARDAGRPNTGPTGFDPRRSPAWPGAAVTW